MYPTELISRSPSPEAISQTQTEEELGAEAGDGRDDDERKSRAVSPRDGTPEETPKGGDQTDEATEETEEAKDGADAAISGEAAEAVGADEKPITQDVEMGEATAETPATEGQAPLSDIEEPASAPGPSATNGNGDDIEMASSQPKTLDSTPPTSSAAPSRPPSPPPTKSESKVVEKPKARPLKCVRHTICHSASLLSLSFDKAGR